MSFVDAERDLIETGTEPEFIAHDLSRFEDAGDGLIRVFVASRHGKTDRVEYTVVCTAERLAHMCRKGLMFAAEANTKSTIRGH